MTITNIQIARLPAVAVSILDTDSTSTGTSGVYAIENIVDGGVYIGSTVKLKKRWSCHRGMLRRGVHTNKHLQGAWNKYGENSFIFSVLEYCNKGELIKQEQKWIDRYGIKNLYNFLPNAGSTMGIKYSPEQKQRTAVTAKLAFESRSLEDQIKFIQYWKGKKQAPEHKAKRVLAWIGRKHSQKSKAKMSATKKQYDAYPQCPECGGEMGSRGIYWRCTKCGKRVRKENLSVERLEAQREVWRGAKRKRRERENGHQGISQGQMAGNTA